METYTHSSTQNIIKHLIENIFSSAAFGFTEENYCILWNITSHMLEKNRSHTKVISHW